MFGWFTRLTEDYELESEGETLFQRICDLEERVLKLECENVELTNCLYEVENRLQAQIDNIHPVTYNIKNTNWDQ